MVITLVWACQDDRLELAERRALGAAVAHDHVDVGMALLGFFIARLLCLFRSHRNPLDSRAADPET